MRVTLPIREEFTRIRVDPSGKWYTGNLRIKNEKVLGFFKKNLHRDEKGIYIYNTFGEFSEKGYIKVGGPLLKVVELDQNQFTLENGEIILSTNSEIISDEGLTPYLRIPSLGAWASLSSYAAVKFGEFTHESGEGFFFQRIKIKMCRDIEWS